MNISPLRDFISLASQPRSANAFSAECRSFLSRLDNALTPETTEKLGKLAATFAFELPTKLECAIAASIADVLLYNEWSGFVLLQQIYPEFSKPTLN